MTLQIVRGCNCEKCSPAPYDSMKHATELAEAFVAYTKALEAWNKRKVVPISEARLRRGDRL